MFVALVTAGTRKLCLLCLYAKIYKAPKASPILSFSFSIEVSITCAIVVSSSRWVISFFLSASESGFANQKNRCGPPFPPQFLRNWINRVDYRRDEALPVAARSGVVRGVN